FWWRAVEVEAHITTGVQISTEAEMVEGKLESKGSRETLARELAEERKPLAGRGIPGLGITVGRIEFQG
ncbi:MAG: hypothetical protein EBU84_14430, partial [Actinobacteria bacterium]|nr:hypothetical protein [Actinomycetota bacterium]